MDIIQTDIISNNYEGEEGNSEWNGSNYNQSSAKVGIDHSFVKSHQNRHFNYSEDNNQQDRREQDSNKGTKEITQPKEDAEPNDDSSESEDVIIDTLEDGVEFWSYLPAE